MKYLCTLLLTLALGLPAWADGINLVNSFGSVSVSNAGIVSNNSQLKWFNGIQATHGHSLGYVNFSTGALLTGSIAAGGTFSDVGSSFYVWGAGHQGVPLGTIFSGTFVGPIDWTLVSGSGTGNLTYELSGVLRGMLYTGQIVSGMTTQTIFSTGGQLSKGIGHIRTGTTNLAVPEPGTMGMLGTGLVMIGSLVRRKVVAAL